VLHRELGHVSGTPQPGLPSPVTCTGLDLQIPDSRFAREAEELLRMSSPDFLTNHCYRSYAWAVALAEHDRVRFDPELLYIAALLHDLGLVDRFDTGGCFEEDGARVAADLAAVEGWSAERTEALAEAIRLHVAVESAIDDGPEAYLLWHATALDVTGSRHGDLASTVLTGVVDAYPWLDFKRAFTGLIVDQAARKPTCWAAAAIRGGIAERIATATFD
jgi:HD domain